MDTVTRGEIEETLDRLIAETDTRNAIQWVLKEVPVRSHEDFALGYLVGSLTNYAYGVARRSKQLDKIEKMTAEELGKDKKRPARMRVFLTTWENNVVRNMLRKRLVDIRRKVSRDFQG